MHRRYPV